MISRWESPEAREIAAAVDVDDPQQAVRLLARRLLDEHANGTIPVPLQAFFTWAGIRKVRHEDTPLDGALRRLPDGRFDIVLKEDAPPTRQRFSTAHELGHALFYRYAPVAKARQLAVGGLASQEEERLCNIAAEELLMPEPAVAAALRRETGVHRVVALARDCEVSVEAALVRLSRLWPGTGELQLWSRGPKGWELKLARPMARSRGSLRSFVVQEWGDSLVPDGRTLPWDAETVLYSQKERVRHVAHTSVVELPRRVPTLLVAHEIRKRPGGLKPTDVERAARDRVRRAWATLPQPDCSLCGGTGVLQPDLSSYPANRGDVPRLCPCRFDRGPAALSA